MAQVAIRCASHHSWGAWCMPTMIPMIPGNAGPQLRCCEDDDGAACQILMLHPAARPSIPIMD